MEIIFLILYNFLFFHKFYRNPYLLCTSELASTYFPFWRWSKGKISYICDIYYPLPACIPFLSSFYPWQIVSSWFSQYLSLDTAFKLFSYGILLHYLVASIIAYKLLGLFGAITLTYAGYCIKPQTPSFVYTIAWIPGCFIKGWIGIACLSMAILGGYWPVLVYLLPAIAFFNPLSLLGVIGGLPQIIPFLWYWPKSVRSGEKIDRNFGRIPWWKLKDLFIPTNQIAPTNGVHYPEVAMYMGIAVLFIWKISWWWFPLLLPFLIMIGLLPSIQRIPSRSLYLLTLCIVLSFELSYSLHTIQILLLIQGLLLLRNASIYPSFPFSQWWDKPSKLYQKYKDDVWPNFTGYLRNKHIKWYEGGFSLKHG